MLDKGLGHRCSTSMFDDPPSRTPTPEDWSELAADDDRCDDVSEVSVKVFLSYSGVTSHSNKCRLLEFVAKRSGGRSGGGEAAGG